MSSIPESTKCWLMKAEPDSRVVKGQDVKFSVDDFERVKRTPWEGVRNHEAKNLMKEMKVGDNILFYHSNCKNPGVAGFAKVAKEAYPDYTAWDSSHPYYDPKSDESAPKWFMIDAEFESRTAHFVPLSYLRTLAAHPGPEPPSEVAYIGSEGVQAIKGMALVNRGRLSVQRVESATWEVITLMAQRGGWEDGNEAKATKAKTDKKAARISKERKQSNGEEENSNTDTVDTDSTQTTKLTRKRKVGEHDEDGSQEEEGTTRRRSARLRK